MNKSTRPRTRPGTVLASVGRKDSNTINETTGGRRRHARFSVRPRRIGVLTVTAGLVLLVAACAGRPSSPSSSSSGAYGALPAFAADELSFSRCMRAHGVSNYPDPMANGQLPPSTNKQQLISDPSLPSASRACAHLIPQSVVNAQNQADMRGYVKFAQCMRSHRVLNFPDPTTDSDGTPIFNVSTTSIDIHSPQVRATALRCVSLLHLGQLPNARYTQ